MRSGMTNAQSAGTPPQLSVLIIPSITAAWMEHPKVGGTITRNLSPPDGSHGAGWPGDAGQGAWLPSAEVLIIRPAQRLCRWPFGLPLGPGLPGPKGRRRNTIGQIDDPVKLWIA